MTTEDRLREAIRTRTSEVQPSPPPEGLRSIEQKLAEARRAGVRRGLLMGLASAAAVLAVVAIAVSVIQPGDDGDNISTADDRTTTSSSPTTEAPATTETTEPSSTTSTSTTTTTTTSPTTTTPAPPADTAVDPSVPVWPSTEGSQRFDDPAEAARNFAVELAGFRDPVVGPFQADGDRSGAVVVRPAAQGPATNVMVRQLEDDTWWVVASSTADITLDQPGTGAQVTCPLRLTGTALAFEGTVAVSLRDGQGGELGSGFVTGGGDVARPFDGTIECSVGGGPYGTLLLTEASAEDGSTTQVVARRVAL